MSPAALAAATARLLGAHVRLEQRSLPQDWPDGRFDLVVLSELLYYLSDDDLRTVAARAVEAIAPGGTLLSIHWLHHVDDYPQTGEAVQLAVADAARGHLVRSVRHVEADFDLTVHVRARPGEDPRRVSVAGRNGLC